MSKQQHHRRQDTSWRPEGRRVAHRSVVKRRWVRAPIYGDRRVNTQAPICPSKKVLADQLIRSGITFSPEQVEKLWGYHTLIRRRNEDADLTRLFSFEAMVQKHYVDCLMVGKFIKPPTPLLDIGTGAGFPGIPLKILYPDLDIILAEPRPRRVQFLNEVISTLGLKKVRIFGHKVVSRSFQEPIKGVITRALEPIEKTMLRTSASLEQGGLLIFMKGPAVEPEIRSARQRLKDKYRLVNDWHYVLPHSMHQRRLLVFEKLVDRELLPSATT